uniref:Uncharacterized protein n=1 Tax=Strombidium rassoulzadegani TaxID=1082188 RepID=A0A7S3CSQ9_9SPIT|mmetsp:Transcript_3808/g.6487  ORF Transcript_3808/g.6487 Transcript_3808/m.6487 type:complete len:320 (+) Transcript_3808:402-1361(+)
MYPQGCPGFQKASVKLFRVAKGAQGKEKLKLVDNQYFNNKEGFGFMLRNLTKGDYQIQVKKYSFGFDVFDFSARIYSRRNIKLVDVEQQEIQRAKEKQDKKKDSVGGSRTITESSNPTSKETSPKRHFTKAGDQDTNEKFMIDVDPNTQIDMELHKGNLAKEVEQEEVKQAEKGSSNGIVEQIRGPLSNKLSKAVRLASDPANDQFFEIHRREFYYIKDAIDAKHGYYFLRVGSNSDRYDLSLKIKMFVKGDLVETTERNEKLYVYKYPEDKFPGDFKLTTFCKIMPLKGKRTCDFLVPTNYHDRTYVYIQKKETATKR